MSGIERALVISLSLILVLAGCAPSGVQQLNPTPAVPSLGSYAASSPNPSPTPQLTPIERMGVTGVPATVDIEEYRLRVDGRVENPLTLTYEDLRSLPTVTMAPMLECPGFFVDYALWTGPLVRLVLEQARTQPDATSVVFSDSYGYRRTLKLEAALADNVFLAHTLYGEQLPAVHGYPLRLVAGDYLGDYWVKWLAHIEVQ